MSRYDVSWPAHTVGRHTVPAARLTAPGDTKGAAVLQAIQWAYGDAGLPPWKPYMRETYALARAYEHFDIQDERKKEMRARDEKRREQKARRDAVRRHAK